MRKSERTGLRNEVCKTNTVGRTVEADKVNVLAYEFGVVSGAVAVQSRLGEVGSSRGVVGVSAPIVPPAWGLFGSSAQGIGWPKKTSKTLSF